MKTLREIRDQFDFNIKEQASKITHLKNYNIDFNIFLPSIGKNLQRDLVWTLDQKRELIWSMLIKRHIPHIAIINTNEDVYEIIDGKQRLSTMFEFLDDKFTIILDNKEFVYSTLPNDYHIAIRHYFIRIYVIYEEHDKKISDQEKINWFRFINYAGTPQDREHFESLIKQ